MPIYEYECLVCGIHFDCLRHFDDPPLKECPQGHQGVRRVFSPPAIVFNGPGFYVTDNRNDTGGHKKPGDKQEDLSQSKAADHSP